MPGKEFDWNNPNGGDGKGDRMPGKETPYVREDGKTVITNKCGHEFAYTIRKESAVKWLQGRPCPSCARKNPNKNEPTPDPKPSNENETTPETPEPSPVPDPMPEKKNEPTAEQIAAVLETFPKVPEGLQHKAFVDVMLLVDASLPVWMQGPPGTSKSTIAEQVSEALNLDFYYLQCHEMMTRTDLFGYTDANGTDHKTPLWEAYSNGGVFLLDEVDNGNPNLLAAMNSALANGHCVFGSGTAVKRHPDFRCVATANTAGLGPEHGFIGRNGVDLATRDRFVTVQVLIDDVLEDALAAIAIGEDDYVASVSEKVHERANRQLKKRATQAASETSRSELLDAVRIVRSAVESRFRGTVVSPRTTIHAGTMLTRGFTLAEALSSKLPGLNASEIKSVLTEVKN